MQNSNASSEYLDKALDGYRQAVQTFARDAWIVIGLVALITAFVFFPFLRSAEQEADLKSQIEKLQGQRKTTYDLLIQMTNLETGVTNASKDVEQLGRNAASHLSQRLSDFAGYVQSLGNPSRAPRSNVLQHSPVEQFNVPNAPNAVVNARTLLRVQYGLSEEDIASLVQPMGKSISAASPNRVETISLQVFHREIDKSYSQLNAAIQTRIDQLNQGTRSNLDLVRKSLADLGIPFPDEQKMEVKFTPVPRPGDDTLFYTRSGKGETLASGVAPVESTIDAAVVPLRRPTLVLSDTERALEQNLEKLIASKQNAEERIQKLQDGVGEVQKELARVSVPFNWMPMNMSTFARAFPVLATLAFLILAVRFEKMSRFRLRLIREMSEAQVKTADFELALSVPDVTLDFLSLPRTDGTLRAKAFSAFVALALLGFLNLVLLRIYQSPLFKPSSHLGVFIAVEALAVIASILVFQSLRRSFKKKTEPIPPVI